MIVDLLKGKWLGHPLHPLLVHVPMALWPAALLFDLLSRAGFGGNAMVRTSFFAIGLGLAVALLAVPTGIVDWSGIKREKPAWKIGLWHMLLNAVARVLFSISFVLDVASLIFRGAPGLVAGAFYSMALGLIGALIAAIPGLADYSGIRRDHPARRTATWHMLLNLCAVALYAANLYLRRDQLTATSALAI